MCLNSNAHLNPFPQNQKDLEEISILRKNFCHMHIACCNMHIAKESILRLTFTSIPKKWGNLVSGDFQKKKTADPATRALNCARFTDHKPPRPLGLLLCPAISGGLDILLGDRFRPKLACIPPLLTTSIELDGKKP
jgi:hypothetical protein